MSILKIKDLTEQIRGVSYKPSDVVTSDIGLPILRANNIKDNSLSFDDLVFIKPEKVSKKQLLQNGDIVICASSGSKELVGKAGVFCNNDTYSFGAFCKAVRVKRIDGIDSDYVRLYFSSKYYRECIALSSKGSNINNIKTENIEELNINIPSIEEQNTAVSLLNALISAIDNKKQELFSLDELVKSRFIEMFGHYFEDVRYFVKVGDIATATIGLTYKPDNVTDEGIIVLRSGNIQNAELCLSDDIVRVSNIKIKEDKFVRENDILMCSRNGSARLVGKCCLIPKLNEQMSYGAFMTVIRSRYPYFLNGFFNSTYFLQQLTGTQTASVNQITTGMLNGYTVIKPSDTEENEFAEFVKLIDKSKFVCHSKNFLCDIFTFSSSTIAYPSVVSIFVCPKRC